MKALLDTHVLLWWLGPASRLSPAQWEVIESAGPEEPLWVSEISHRDPADRIIVASAKVLGATLLTQDQRILEGDLVPTLA